MNYSSSKFYSLVVASLLFSTVSLSAVSSNNLVNASSFIDHEQKQSSFAENEIIVTFKEGADVFDTSKDASSPLSVMSDMTKDYMAGFNSDFKNLLDAKLGKEKFTARGYRKLGAMHIKSDVNSTEELMAIFKSDEIKKYIKSISKNNIMALSSSNDSYYSKLWAVENTGQEVNNKSGTADADMDIVEAWNTTKGDKDVIVAVLDTGVDYSHDDLKENMWSGLEKHGLDFAGNNNGDNDDDPMPDKPYDDNGHYHGTHVAGIIGAVGNNEKGISGVAQNVAIMALKVFRPNGSGYSSDIMEALDYIAERIDAGDNIVAINASYGGGGSQNDATNDAIKKLGEKGVVFCAAAGNDGKDIDDEPTYPASYDASNIIAVAASDQDDKLANFSNYGANSVDVAAPGTNILSTYPDNQYAYLQGTSMATPNVAGAIALLASEYPNSTVAERKAMILDNVEKKSAFNGKMTTGGRVNINDALEDEPKNEENPNSAPLANDDSATTAYETAVTIDVLANDSDNDGDKLTIKSVSDASNGTVKIEDGKVVYTPKGGFEGDDSFEYTITDGEAETTAKVSVTVNKKKEEPNVAPVAKDDSATTAYETVVTIDVLANDSDEDDDKLTIKSLGKASNGKVEIQDGKVVYTPNDKFEGDDNFEYTVSDGEAESKAKVTVTVEEKVNTAPVAKDDTATANHNESVIIEVLKNDSDEDGDKLSIVSFTEASHGTVSQDDDNLVYTPNKDYSGDDSFTYTITDGEVKATANVSIKVKEKSEEIKLPVFDEGFGMGQNSDEWENVDFSNHDINFGTKDGTKVSMGLDKDNQLVGSIKVNGKESKLTINVPDTSMKIDSKGATLIEFKGKEMSITIGSDGTISPKLPTLKNAVLPKKALPLGTELTVSGDLMKFVLPLSDEIKF